MRFHLLKLNIRSFWTYQLIGWSIFFLAGTAHILTIKTAPLNKFIIESIETISGLLITLGLRYLYHRINHHNFSIFRLIGRISLYSVAATILWIYISSFGRSLFYKTMLPTALNSFGAFIGWVDVFFPILFSWSALYFGIKFWLEWDSQRDKADRANFVAEEAKLQMLRYQLNPHFLFNALNSIRAMISENDHQARSMVTELSEFLRYQLIFRDDKETMVKDEIEAVKHYLCIEKKRYEEKLNVSFEIDPKIENYPILGFLIHPLVENAVKYGMRTSKLPLTIKIKADQIENGVRLSVINSGSWIDHTTDNNFGKDGTGTGLANVKERLKVKFPDNHKFEYSEKDDKVNVVVEIFNSQKN